MPRQHIRILRFHAVPACRQSRSHAARPRAEERVAVSRSTNLQQPDILQDQTIRPKTVTLISKLIKPLVDEGLIGVKESKEILAQLRQLARTGELAPPVEPKLLTQAQCAEALSLSLSNFKKQESLGNLPGLSRRYAGSSVRYRSTDLARFILADDEPNAAASQDSIS